MKTLIIIPTLNSQKNLLDVISKLKISVPNVDILVIDRGSTDRTKYLLKNNKINYLKTPVLSSYYQALSLGMIFASKNKYNMAIEWNDKDKFNSNEIKYFMTIMERKKPDYILGSRFLNKKTPHGHNSFVMKIFKMMVIIGLRKKITDPAMSFRAYGKRAIDYFALYNSPTPSIDSIVETIKSGLTFREEQTTFKNDVGKYFDNKILYSSRELLRWGAWSLFVLPFKKRIIITKKRGK